MTPSARIDCIDVNYKFLLTGVLGDQFKPELEIFEMRRAKVPH